MHGVWSTNKGKKQMKKLLIIVAAMMSISVASAASVTWTLSGVQASDGSGNANGYLAMVFDAATSQSAVIEAILAKDTATLGTLANSWAQDTKSTSAGFMRSAGNGSYAANDTYSVYLVLFDASTVADAANYFITSTKSGNIAANGANATLAFGTYASQVSAGGTWTAVPEPTSGLLMLLGMAGLALRRRRA